MRNGLEDRTILSQWTEVNRSPPCTVEHLVTEAVPIRDQVHLATDIYLPSEAKKVLTMLVRILYRETMDTSCYFRFVQRGYAVVIQDVWGREDSEGEWLSMRYGAEDRNDVPSRIVRQS